jgi:hypothetical protein
MVPAGELLASYANEATAEPLLDKRKAICAPAGAGRRHQDAAYPLKDGLEVRGAAKDPLGCALALPFDEVSLRPFHRDR